MGLGARPKSKAADELAKAAEVFEKARAAACREAKLGLTKIHNQLMKGEPPALRKTYEAMNDAVCECYGWPKDTWRDEAATVAKLVALNDQVRSGR